MTPIYALCFRGEDQPKTLKSEVWPNLCLTTRPLSLFINSISIINSVTQLGGSSFWYLVYCHSIIH